ncbi:MAG: hypothetical protein ABSD32_02185 [Mycobacterium sp.]
MCLRYPRTPTPRPEHYLPLGRYGDRELVWQYCAKAIGIESP